LKRFRESLLDSEPERIAWDDRCYREDRVIEW